MGQWGQFGVVQQVQQVSEAGFDILLDHLLELHKRFEAAISDEKLRGKSEYYKHKSRSPICGEIRSESNI